MKRSWRNRRPERPPYKALQELGRTVPRPESLSLTKPGEASGGRSKSGR